MTISSSFPQLRLQRLRRNENIRRLVRETEVTTHHLVLPLFIKHGRGDKIPIQSMPGYYQLHLEQLRDEIKEVVALRIPAVMLFGIPAQKDGSASQSYQDDGIIQQAIREI